MLSLFNFHKNYLPHKIFIKILSFFIEIVFSLSTSLLSDSRQSYASGNNKPKRQPAVLKADSVTVFWIVAAFLFIPLVLTGLFSH